MGCNVNLTLNVSEETESFRICTDPSNLGKKTQLI